MVRTYSGDGGVKRAAGTTLPLPDSHKLYFNQWLTAFMAASSLEQNRADTAPSRRWPGSGGPGTMGLGEGEAVLLEFGRQRFVGCAILASASLGRLERAGLRRSARRSNGALPLSTARRHWSSSGRRSQRHRVVDENNRSRLCDGGANRGQRNDVRNDSIKSRPRIISIASADGVNRPSVPVENLLSLLLGKVRHHHGGFNQSGI